MERFATIKGRHWTTFVVRRQPRAFLWRSLIDRCTRVLYLYPSVCMCKERVSLCSCIIIRVFICVLFLDSHVARAYFACKSVRARARAHGASTCGLGVWDEKEKVDRQNVKKEIEREREREREREKDREREKGKKDAIESHGASTVQRAFEENRASVHANLDVCVYMYIYIRMICICKYVIVYWLTCVAEV